LSTALSAPRVVVREWWILRALGAAALEKRDEVAGRNEVMTLARPHVFDHGTEGALAAVAGSDAHDVQIVHPLTVTGRRPFSVRWASLGIAQL
jgi:hypothetical protein